MDAKARANFINSVAGGQKIPCPKCNNLNEPDSRFCAICGTELNKKEAEIPFAPIKKVEEVKKEMVKEPVKIVVPEVVVEEKSVFAEGLPAWDIEPPQIMVRRKRR